MSMILIGQIVLWFTLIMMIFVIAYGFIYFDEWEVGVEFLPAGYNSFELGVSNRNYPLDDGGLEQELRIGVLLFSFIFLFRRFGA